jgi:HAE1 family hydrophobic/amphiphilic exporter-1
MLENIVRHMESMAILVATIVLFIKIPKGFLPSEDQGQIIIQLEGAQGISYAMPTIAGR